MKQFGHTNDKISYNYFLYPQIFMQPVDFLTQWFSRIFPHFVNIFIIFKFKVLWEYLSYVVTQWLGYVRTSFYPYLRHKTKVFFFSQMEHLSDSWNLKKNYIRKYFISYLLDLPTKIKLLLVHIFIISPFLFQSLSNSVID